MTVNIDLKQKGKLRFQPPSINISTIKIIEGNDIPSRLTNLLSYIWIRRHYKFEESFAKFCTFKDFDLWEKNIKGRTMTKNGYGITHFYRMRDE